MDGSPQSFRASTFFPIQDILSGLLGEFLMKIKKHGLY